MDEASRYLDGRRKRLARPSDLRTMQLGLVLEEMADSLKLLKHALAFMLHESHLVHTGGKELDPDFDGLEGIAREEAEHLFSESGKEKEEGVWFAKPPPLQAAALREVQQDLQYHRSAGNTHEADR